MVYLKLILNLLALPIGLTATILIISRNTKNIPNILIGIVVFLGGFLSMVFATIKQVIFVSKPSVAYTFGLLSHLSFIWMGVPAIIFSIYFWRNQYPHLAKYLYFFSPVPSFFLTGWLILYPDTLMLIEKPLGVDNILSVPYCITSSILSLVVFFPMIFELGYMARKAKGLPTLRTRMQLFTLGYSIGIIGGLISIMLFPFFGKMIELASIFIIISTIFLSLAFFNITSPKKVSLWHVCPKLLTEKDGTTYCLNTKDGTPRKVFVIKIGKIVEQMQIDKNLLETDEWNCLNTVYSDEQGIIHCLTSHKPIKVLGEKVREEEMDLTKEMLVGLDKEACTQCLHKIIAYRKQHKNLTKQEIKEKFLGISLEEFFGLA
ncbi:MAG: hypothetical protein GF308_11510 [Candidatus Heimdallarchaeota archaeon]|nr:hypothetical protein [Candidatus Heimdallarchaeota archaeon]